MTGDEIRAHVMAELKESKEGTIYGIDKIAEKTGASVAEIKTAMGVLPWVRANTKNGEVVGYAYKGGKRPGWI